MLGIIVSTIAITLFINLILKRFQLPTIIGYIFTGTIIAYLFGLHSSVNNHTLKEIAEFGVVFLMFTIGLEFSVEHLKKMKKEVFFTGTLQIVLTSIFVYVLSYFVLGLDYKTSMIIGAALSLSSTAIVLKTFNETKEINKPYGKRVLGILIMQDIAVIPILLMISFFTMNENASVFTMILNTLIAGAILLTLLYFSGKYLLEPFLKIISNTKCDELFVSSVLLLAIGSSYLAHYFGFSYSLGAFIAGMMIAETKFKHQVEADLIPFRNILLGVFFITVGMQINFKLIFEYIWIILALLPILMGLKYLIIYFLVKFEEGKRVAFKTAVSLIQIGEFSLAILELARSKSLIDPTYSQILIVTIVISMILTPIILKNLSGFANKVIREDILEYNEPYNIDPKTKDHILVLGYGRFGQAIVKELKNTEQKYVIIEHNHKFFEDGQKRNEPIVFGNATQKHILNSVNISDACAIIVAVHNPETLHLICEAIDELNKSAKTIISIANEEDKEFLSDLHLEHVIVENQQVAKGVIDEILQCKLV